MRIRKIMAMAIAAILVLSSTGAVFASEITDPVGSQNGSVEGGSTYVDTVKYKVTLPTTESLGFNIDPEGLYGYFSDEANQDKTSVDPGDLEDYEGKIASTGTASITNKSSIPVVVTTSFSIKTTAEGIAFKGLNDVLDPEKNEMAIGVIPVVSGSAISLTNALSIVSSDDESPDDILFGLNKADYEFTFDGVDYDYEQKAPGEDVVDATNAYFRIGGYVSKDADWKQIGEDGKEVNLDCVFSFVGAKVIAEGALADDDSGVVVDVEKITFLVEAEPEPETTPAKFQTIASAGGPGVDLTSSYTVDKGIYTRVGENLITTSYELLGTVKINGIVVTIDTKGNSAGNGGGLWFKPVAGTSLEVGDVITAVIDGVTYTFTVAS